MYSLSLLFFSETFSIWIWLFPILTHSYIMGRSTLPSLLFFSSGKYYFINIKYIRIIIIKYFLKFYYVYRSVHMIHGKVPSNKCSFINPNRVSHRCIEKEGKEAVAKFIVYSMDLHWNSKFIFLAPY